LFYLPLLLETNFLVSASVTNIENHDYTHSDKLEVDTLQEVIVNGRQPLSNSQKLSGKELHSLSTSSVADAIKYFAGVQIKDFGGLGGMKTVNVRSMGAQHVGVFIDGVKINNAQNGTVDLGKFSLSSMESVNLYNGNKLGRCQSPSEYASGATVYFTTRRPQRDSLSIQFKGSSFNTTSGKFNLQGAKKGWQGFIDAEALYSKGNYPYRYKSDYENTTGERTNNDIRYYRTEAAVFNQGFSTHIYYYYSSRGCPGGIIRRVTDKYTNIAHEWDSDFFIQSSYRRSDGPHSMSVIFKYSNEYLRYNTDYPDNQNTPRVDNHYHQNDAYASVSYSFSPLVWLNLNAGYDFRCSWLAADLKYFNSVRRQDQKAVIAADLSWNNFRLSSSMLYQDLHDFTEMKTPAAEPLRKFTPSVTIGYDNRYFTIHAWYKRIFRAPTLNDLYYTQAGNRNLKPEYTTQYDIGGSYNFAVDNWDLMIQADAYINKVENRIVCLPLKGSYTWSMMNYGYTFCKGLNSNLNIRFHPGKWTFSLLSAFTLQRDLDRTDKDSEMYNKPICYSPVFSCGISAILAFERLSLTVSNMYVGKRMWSYADPEDVLRPYDNVDLKINYSVNPFKKFETVLTFEVNDLFDVQYELVPRYPMPGRRYSLTLALGF
ncbi:MAG: TonB-dependent receptor, partial [Muribaculaceae bacterium]|nr:TonB-dependent receptor [Muribaculaceae bacterium]